jgi:uncharacterized membrane protein YvbJ
MEGSIMEKKFCVHCGAEVNPQAVVCVHCGCSLTNTQTQTKTKSSDNSDVKEIIRTLIKVFMIIGIISGAFALIPLIWCLPMNKKVNKYLEGQETLSLGFKICVLLFVNVIAGVLLIVDENI